MSEYRQPWPAQPIRLKTSVSRRETLRIDITENIYKITCMSPHSKALLGESWNAVMEPGLLEEIDKAVTLRYAYSNLVPAIENTLKNAINEIISERLIELGKENLPNQQIKIILTSQFPAKHFTLDISTKKDVEMQIVNGQLIINGTPLHEMEQHRYDALGATQIAERLVMGHRMGPGASAVRTIHNSLVHTPIAPTNMVLNPILPLKKMHRLDLTAPKWRSPRKLRTHLMPQHPGKAQKTLKILNEDGEYDERYRIWRGAGLSPRAAHAASTATSMTSARRVALTPHGIHAAEMLSRYDIIKTQVRMETLAENYNLLGAVRHELRTQEKVNISKVPMLLRGSWEHVHAIPRQSIGDVATVTLLSMAPRMLSEEMKAIRALGVKFKEMTDQTLDNLAIGMVCSKLPIITTHLEPLAELMQMPLETIRKAKENGPLTLLGLNDLPSNELMTLERAQNYETLILVSHNRVAVLDACYQRGERVEPEIMMQLQQSLSLRQMRTGTPLRRSPRRATL